MMQIYPQVDASVRVLIVDVPSYPAKRQREECAAFGRGHEFRTFEEWVELARGRDTMVVASLRLLADQKRGPIKPGPVARLRRRIARALEGGIVVEASTGATSVDAARWAAAVRVALGFVRSGGHMSGEAAKARARKGARKGGAVMKAKSAAERWKREPKLLEQCKRVWRSRDLVTDAARLDAVNDMLAAMDRAAMQFGSSDTARRVLGKVRTKN
jgi:hypothetical protein